MPAGILLLSALACERTSDAPPRQPAGPSPPAGSVFDLRPGEPRRHEIEVGETHVFPLDLGADEYLHLEVEQLGSDVYLELSGPPGFLWPTVDSSNDATTVEALFVVTGGAGEYRVAVRAGAPGAYEVRLDPPRKPEDDDRLRSEAHRAFYGARVQRQDPETAARMYGEAIEKWRQLGDKAREARAHYELYKVLPREKADAAEGALEDACGLFEEVRDLRQAARCLHLLGGLRKDDLRTARDLNHRSLTHWRELRSFRDVSVVACDLASVERRLGRPAAARELLLEAVEAAGRARDSLQEGRARARLGALYHYRGQTPEAVKAFRGALEALAAIPPPLDERSKRERAWTLTRLGTTLPFVEGSGAEEAREARAALEEALDLRRDLELADPAGLAATLNGLGVLDECTNRPREALEAYGEAEEIYRTLGHATSAAVVQGNRCRALERLGRLEAARECYLESLLLLRAVGYQNAEAHALYGLARIERRRGELHRAQERIHEVLEIVDLVRREAESEDLRLSYFGRKYDYYEAAIDLALELHQQEPGAGHDEAAYHRLESARARVLLEALARFRPELEPPPDLRELRAEIHRLRAGAGEARGDVSKSVDKLEKDLGASLDRLRAASPRYAIVEPQILSVEEVRELLDPGTLLLEYHLGETRSAVWAIRDEGVVLRFLPRKEEIEEIARKLYQAMRGGAHRIRTWGVDELAIELSRRILEPVADLLDRPQLVIVPAGALRYVPFAALPHPAGLSHPEPPPLLLSHRIISVPSASVLAALRDLQAGRPPPGSVAILAAPVLRSDDPRLAGGVVGASLATDDPRDGSLPWAAEEARVLLDLVEGDAVLPALGFEASREVVFSGVLRDYRVLHFATHGRLDDLHGELSALALSRFDAAGRSLDGELFAWELYQLDLSADLVVLSACETALGQEIRGEGLVGLTRGFFYAGARSLLASLWRVDDEATAHLMQSFYRGYLHRDLHPAEALRQAQIELRRQGWRAPFYWAPFIYEGDWQAEPPGPPASSAKRVSSD